jgi:hypothetical protein
MEETILTNEEKSSDIERKVSEIIFLMSNTEFGLIDTNFLRTNPRYTPDIRKKFKGHSDPFIDSFMSSDRNSKCLEPHTTEDLTQTRKGYNLYTKILRDQENIYVLPGIFKEFEVLSNVYKTSLERLGKKEKFRKEGKKRKDNLSKIEDVRRIKKSLKRLMGVLEKRIIYPDYMSEEYGLINRAFPNGDQFPSKVDKDLVKCAFYYLFTEEKEVSIFSNDIHIPQLVSTFAKRTRYEDQKGALFSRFYSGEKRVINVYKCWNGSFSCQKFLEASVCKK